MKNQECKIRPEIININTNNPIFYPFSIKLNKCSDNCNNINNPYAKVCVPDVIKGLNVKLFNLMSITNEIRFIKWHGKCKCKCRLDAIVCNNKQRWNKNKCRCECKELIDKRVCDKRYIWNASNCECQCDTNFDIGEYLDYENCKCRKKLVDKLMKECTETVEEITPFENENNYEYNCCIVYIVLMIVVFYNFYWNYCLFSLLQLVFD